MEGVGSRLGRASSRYGPAPVFSGPVRRWKKRWIHVPTSNVSLQSQTNGQDDSGSRLMLCRWTPAPTMIESAGGNAEAREEPPRRKIKYTPIAPLGKQSKEVAAETDARAKTRDSSQSTEEQAFDIRCLSGKSASEEEASTNGIKAPKTVSNLGLGL